MSRIIRTAAVAVVMAFSAAAVAHAAPADVTVSVADIDPSTSEGAKILRARTEAVARDYCKQTGPGSLSQRATCRENISDEVNRQVTERQLAMKARATALAEAQAKTTKQ